MLASWKTQVLVYSGTWICVQNPLCRFIRVMRPAIRNSAAHRIFGPVSRSEKCVNFASTSWRVLKLFKLCSECFQQVTDYVQHKNVRTRPGPPNHLHFALAPVNSGRAIFWNISEEGGYATAGCVRVPRCTITNTSNKAPLSRPCHHGLMVPSRLKMLSNTPSRRSPINVAGTLPLPPVSSVPPTTTAAMASNSHPVAATGCAAPSLAAKSTPADAASSPLIAYAVSLVRCTFIPSNEDASSLSPSE